MTGIAVVCLLDSIHSARWVRQIARAHPESQIYVTPSGPHRRVSRELLSLESESQGNIRIYGSSTVHGFFASLIDSALGTSLQAFNLIRIIKQGEISLVCALEIQHAGYQVLKLLEKNRISKNFRFLVSNWGSDTNHFLKFKRHEKRIISLIHLADVYTAECERDLATAQKLGFGGTGLHLLPNSIFDVNEGEKLLSPIERRIILVKGYHGWAGRSLMVLAALRGLRSEIRPLEIVVFSANTITILVAWVMKHLLRMKIRAFPKSSFSERQMHGLFRTAKIYIGASISDGISTSALEAMANGCFPIQTNTSCASEWFTPGMTGLDPGPNKNSISLAISKALDICETDTSFQQRNRDLVARRFERAVDKTVLRALRIT